MVSGCNGLTSFLFYPQTRYLQTPEQLGLEWQTVQLKAADGTRISSWYLPAQHERRGYVLFLHGNGENISTHINSVAWLPSKGFAVLLLDYRGYGQSDGNPLLPSVFQDVRAAHEWLLGRRAEDGSTQTITLLGQSIGGALGLTYANSWREGLPQFDSMIIESAPASYRQVAREAMASNWVTWLLQAPASLLPDEFDADQNTAELEQSELLLMHGSRDTIVDAKHLDQLIEKLPEASVLRYDDGHIRGFAHKNVREAAVEFLLTR